MACKHYRYNLIEDHRHYVDNDLYNNCVLCVAEYEGPLNQESIARMMGITKMRVSQIEKNGLKRVRKKIALMRN